MTTCFPAQFAPGYPERMGIRDDVLAAREALATHLDYVALELLDLEIEDED